MGVLNWFKKRKKKPKEERCVPEKSKEKPIEKKKNRKP